MNNFISALVTSLTLSFHPPEYPNTSVNDIGLLAFATLNLSVKAVWTSSHFMLATIKLQECQEVSKKFPIMTALSISHTSFLKDLRVFWGYISLISYRTDRDQWFAHGTCRISFGSGLESQSLTIISISKPKITSFLWKSEHFRWTKITVTENCQIDGSWCRSVIVL